MGLQLSSMFAKNLKLNLIRFLALLPAHRKYKGLRSTLSDTMGTESANS